MIKRKLTIILLALSVNSYSQDTSNIPQGIVYKNAPNAVNTNAKQLISKELSANGDFSLFDSVVIIGPALWDRYSRIDNIAGIKQGNISLKVTSYDPASKKTITELVAAKLIQTKNDYVKVIKQLQNDFGKSEVKFRKLTPLDLQYYWAVIFFDIEEPVFIVEGSNRKILIDIDNNKIKWIDEVL
ncbi:MAG: hypothetical protein QM687_11780 [Ferruginibacter sp.]